MKESTPDQRQRIHLALHKKNLLKHKRDMVSGYTNGRTESSTDMFYHEAEAMLDDLNDYKTESDARQKMIKKMIATAHEMGWIKKKMEVQSGGGMKEVNDYTDLHAWVEKYGYLKKHLNKYTYAELPKLVTAFNNVYAGWLNSKP